MWKIIEYKDIKPNMYEVSDSGTVRNILTHEYLGGNCAKNNKGYKRISLMTVSGKPKKFSLHKIVLGSFIGFSSLEVNHKDGNKLNNQLSNLEYTTRLENAQHAAINNLYTFGEDRWNAIFTNSEIHLICYLMELGFSIPKIIEVLGIPKDHKYISYLNRIKDSNTWVRIRSLYNIDADTVRYKTYPKTMLIDIFEYIHLGFTQSEIADLYPEFNRKKLIQVIKKMRQGKLYTGLERSTTIENIEQSEMVA